MPDNDDRLAARQAVCSLCADVFGAPDRIVRAHWFPIREVRQLCVPHAHNDILQLDLAIGCRGAWRVDQAARPIHGITLTVFYPHQHHGYAEIGAARRGSMVMSIKVKIDPAAPIARMRALATHVTDLTIAQPLIRAWHRLIRAIDGAPHRRLPEAPLRFAEVACLWPVAAGDAVATDGLGRVDEVVEQAMTHIEQNLHRLLTLDELAEAVALSPRQLARRFRSACGTSPGDFADARRVDRARDMLERSDLAVKEIARAVGFASTASFSHWFRRHTGVPASAHRDPTSGEGN